MILGKRILNSFMLFVLIGFNTIRMPNNNILIPGEDQTGTNSLVLSAGGELSYLETDHNVSAREANPGLTPPLSGDAPGVTNPGNQTNNEGAEINLQILASDPEEDPLTYSATGLPDGLSIDPSSGLISGTISYTASSGSVYPVRVTVTDSDDPVNSTDVDFTWTVNDVNGPPVVSAPDDQTSSEGSVISLQIEASDPEGNELSYSAGNLPGDLVIDEETGKISGTINYDAAAASPYTVTVDVMDDGTPNETTQIQFSWEVENTNRAPELTNPGSKTNAEAESISFTPSASDPDGNTLTYSAENLPQGLGINASSGEISGVTSYTASQLSPYSVTITVQDNGSPVLQAQETFTWTITDVNGQPVVTNPGNETNSEGDTVSLFITATDPDEDELTFSASNLPDGLSIDSGSGEISGTLSYTASVTSPYSVIVYADDGGSPNLQGQTSFTWTINNVNGAPEVTTPPNQSDAEGDEVSLSISATDPDGDDLTYSATNLPDGVSIDSGSGLISGTISYSAAGASPYSVSVTVEDDGASPQQAEAYFTWTVAETNRAPQVTDPPDQEDAENDVVSLQIVATDPDGDDLTYSASNLPDGLSINENSGLISGTVSYSAGGSSPYTILVTVEDDGSPAMQEQISILWTITNVNRQPQLDALENQSSSEGQVVSLSVTATDPDGDGLTYSAVNLPDGLSINSGSGLISGTVSYSAAASSPYSVTVTVEDNGSPVLQDDVTIIWTVSDTNQAPDVDTPSDQSDAEGDEVSLQITATDPDGNNLSYSASNLPDGLSIAESTGLISGTITYIAHASSPFSVLVTVTDDGSPSKFSQVSFSWTVADTNQAPTITNPGNRSSAEGIIISLQITAADLDGNTLTYSAVNLPDGLSINPGSGLISGTISYTAHTLSPYNCSVTVTDNGSPVLQDQESFSWTVTDVNAAPQVTDPPDQADAEGDEVSLQINASDPDGDQLTYSATNLPDGLTIGESSGLISGTLSYTASVSSPYTVTVTVTDNGSPQQFTQIEIGWSVSNTNRAPVITNPGSMTDTEGDTINLQIAASDLDGNNLVFSGSGLPDGLSINSSGLISGTISETANDNSPYSVQITVVDDGSPVLQDQVSFTWTIDEANQAPQVTTPPDQEDAEGEVISLQIEASDPDDDDLIYSASGLPDGLSINSETGLISGTIPYTASASSPYEVTVTVEDNGSPVLQDQAEFNWVVTDTNRNPQVTDPGDQSSAEGAVVSLQIEASDPDGNSLTYSASGLPDGLSIEPNTGLISGTISYTAYSPTPYNVVITVTDNGSPALDGQTNFTWTVSNTNRSPELTNPGLQSSAEGASISLQIAADDPDGDTLTYSASGLPDGLSINESSGLISGSISFTAHTSSPYEVTITVIDNGSPAMQDQGIFNWEVSDVNGVPQVTNPGSQSSAEGAVISLQITANDPDEDTLTYSASNLPDGLSINPGSGLISGTISQTASEDSPYNVVITVTDNGTPSEQAQINFSWTVTDTNQAPEVTNPGEQNSGEGAVIELQINAADLDGDDLTYSASGLPAGLSINENNGLISGTISYTASTSSPYEVTVTVTDDGTPNLQDQAVFTWNVTDTNRAPQVTDLGDQSSAEGAVVSLQIEASDSDGNSLTYSASGLPGGLDIDSGSGLISGTVSLTAADNSPYSVVVTVTDNGSPELQGQTSFSWGVSDTNRTPEVTDPGDQNSVEGEIISLQITANDPDEDTLTYSASGLPDALSIDTNSGLISGTISYDAYSPTPYNVVVTATDNGTPVLQGQASFTWTVADTNRAPDVTNPGEQTSAEGVVIELQITASDPDGNGLNYSASNLPDGLSINNETGLITGTISYTAHTGSPYDVTVTVTDDSTSPLQTQVNFAWNVTDVNGTPQVINPGNQTSAEEAVISLQISASDPDEDTLTYTASGLPGGLSIDSGSGLISGTISNTAAESSPYSVIVTAMDNGTPAQQGQASFTWTVSNTNQAPDVTNPGEQTSAEGAVIELQITASDPDGNGITFTASGLPDGLSIDENNGLISGTLPYTAHTGSPYEVTVTVSDDVTPSLQTQVIFDWNVTDMNGPPQVTNPGNQTSAEEAVISLQISASDPDGDTLTYTASGLPGGLSIDLGSGLISGTISNTAAESSPYSVIVTATDNGTPAQQGQASFTWTVSNTNQAPDVTNPGEQTSAEGAVIELQITASDPDGNGITFAASGLPDGLSIDENNGLISGTLPYTAHTGSPYEVTITVSDDVTPSLQTQVIFAWNVTDVNGTPLVTNPGNQTSAEESVISLQISASDPDGGDTLTYSASGLPDGLSIDSGSGLISGTISNTAAQSSPYSVIVTATDNGTPAQQGQASFTWTVSNTNQAPDVTNPGEQTSAEGALISLQIEASDLDGDSLTYSAGDLPEGLSINSASGLISGTVSYDASSGSPYEVTITVTDGGSPQLQDQAVFDWVVNDTNRAPEGTDPGDQSSAEGAVISLQIEAVDLDGDTLTYSAAGLPDELSINTNTGLISGTISYDAYLSSPYSISITILDGGSPELQDQIEFDWTITNTNRAPEVDDPGEQTNAEGAEFSLQILASDPDEDDLTYSATGLPAGYSIDSNTGLISGSASYYASENSPYDIQVTVLDSGTPQQSEVINFEWNISDSTPSSLWYLAEGYTGSGFSTYILIQNPNVDTAYITVTYMLDSGTNIVRLISVPGNSRYTIETHNTDQVGPDAAFATKLESSKSVFVERAMYWPNGSGSSGGHDTEGVKQANTTWYLAEGYTGAGFQTFILIQNPNSSNATITVTYMLEDGSTVERIISVLANSRYTIAVQNEDQLGWDQAFSTKLVSDRPVVVERSMYFSNDGHVSKGVVSPQTTWYLAEGFSGANYNTFILVQNPGLVDANVSVTYMLSDGTIEERNLVVLAQSRYTIAAHESSQVGLDQAFSTQVVADQPIIVERAMYWPNGEGTLGGHGSPGVNSPASTWYLAEGYTGNGTNTFVLLQNPSSTSAQVAVTYMLQGGGVIERNVTVPAKSRYTIETHSSEQVGVDQAFSTKIVSTQPVIVERSMYFNNGGHGAVGVNE